MHTQCCVHTTLKKIRRDVDLNGDLDRKREEGRKSYKCSVSNGFVGGIIALCRYVVS